MLMKGKHQGEFSRVFSPDRFMAEYVCCYLGAQEDSPEMMIDRHLIDS